MPAYSSDKYQIDLGNFVGADPLHVSLNGNLEPDNPLSPLTPALASGFLPTRVANLMFITRLYAWPPPGLDDMLNRIIDLFPSYPRFRVHIWVDLTLAAQIEAEEPAPGYLADMTAMSADVEAMVDSMSNYGFVWEGDPGATAPNTRIQEIIDEMLILA